MNAVFRNAAIAAAVFGLLTTPALAASPKVEKAAAAPVAAAADGKAGGAVTVNGKTTNLTFAYARSVPGSDKTKNNVELILSDVALDAKALADPFVRVDMAKAGKLHAFEIIVNAEGAPVSTTWRHNGFKGPTPSGLDSGRVHQEGVRRKDRRGRVQERRARRLLRQHLRFRCDLPGGDRPLTAQP